MKLFLFLPISVFLAISVSQAQELPSDEAGAMEYLAAKGVEAQKDADGHAIGLMLSGKPAMTADEYQLIGLLVHLEQLGINDAPLADDQWTFLKSLPKLKSLSVWHGKGFATLEPFSGLPIQSLTIGGCMGLRDLNRDDADKLRHAIKTLHDLPNLVSANWYHSPLAPDDSHLEHIAQSFPDLKELRLDFSAPHGSETSITPAGLKHLQRLPLEALSIENAGSFSNEHLAAIAGIETLKALLIDARKEPAPVDAVAAFTKLRPDADVVVAGPDATGPPSLKTRFR